MYNILNLLPISVAYADAPAKWCYNFQDPATPIMEGIIDLHHHIFFFLMLILVFVFYIFYKTLYLFSFKEDYFSKKFNNFQTTNPEVKFTKGHFLADSRFFAWNKLNTFIKTKLNRVTHGVTLEIIWTIIPAVILLFIVVPSFALLYSMEEIIDPTLTVKVIGHQWYWSYEYDLANVYYDANSLNVLLNENQNNIYLKHIAFDSYMVPEEELEEGGLRLLETDNPVVVPVNTHIRFLITASDVIHSWAVPSLGVKVDALPGRLNQASAFIKREGVFYGQCSEICGVNHGFMPITVKAVDWPSFLLWVKSHNE